MKHLDAEHFNLMYRLLERTENFIEVFERAETKMMTWRHEISQQAIAQQTQLETLKGEMDKMQKIIAEAGLDSFRIAAEETVSQTDDYLNSLKNTEQQLLRQIHGHRAELTRITQHAMTRITQKTSQAIELLEEKLSSQAPEPFPPVMLEQIPKDAEPEEKEVCLENTATDIPQRKSSEWRSATLTLVTSLITVIVFGLYTNNEYPWEMHQQAINERDAGKILLNAWPTLTYHEKHKILHHEP